MENSVGDVINLISKSEIRYEGQLHSINTEENTVSLSNVRIYGTEGRRGNVDEVPPTEQIFEFIVFRGSDIKDLTVYRDNSSPQALDPAIVEVHAPSRGRGRAPATSATSVPAPASGGRGGGRSFYDEVPSYSRGNGGNNRRGGYGGGRYHNNNNHSGGGGGNHRNHSNNHGGNNNYSGSRGGAGGGSGNYRRSFRDTHTGQDFQPAASGQIEKFESEFDFSKSREEFEKKKNEFEKAKEDAKSHTKAYDRSSFFDTVSSDQKEKGPSMNRADMRKADTETFGSEMVSTMRGFRRGRGGRGRYQQR